MKCETTRALPSTFEPVFWDSLLSWKQAITGELLNGGTRSGNPNAQAILLLLSTKLGPRLDLPSFSLCWREGSRKGAARWYGTSWTGRILPRFSCVFRQGNPINYSPFFFHWAYDEAGIPTRVHVRRENTPEEDGFRLVLHDSSEPITDGWRWLCSSIVALKAISMELSFVSGEIQRHAVLLENYRLLSENLELLKGVLKSSPDDIFEFLYERSETFSKATSIRALSNELEVPAIEILDRCIGGLLPRGILLRKLRRSGNKDSLGIICEKLEELIRSSKPKNATLGIVLDALQAFRGESVSTPKGGRLGSFLGHWIQMERKAREAVAFPGAPPVEDHAWVCSRDRTIMAIRRHLAKTGWGSLGTEGQHSPSRIRTWLHLWFCLRMLEAENGEGGFSSKLLGPERLRYRADLAYVLRESIRHAVLGREGQFIYQPSTYAAALRSVVEFHALHVVGLPRHTRIRETLELLGNEHRRSSRYLPIDLLRHVLDVYILGHFLMSIEVLPQRPKRGLAEEKSQGEYSPLGQLLAGAGRNPRGKGTLSDFKKVFSLSAIYHDVGHVFLGSQGGLPESVLRESGSILNALEDDLAGIFRRVAGTCVETLPPTLLAGEGAFDLRGWIDRQKRDGWVSHSLLGAWYLLDRCGEADVGCKDVIEAAARAVLLHAAHPVPVDPGRDPAAALLVLCNELFELETSPGQRESAPSAVGRSLHIMAAPRAPSEARYRAVRLRDLVIENGSSGWSAKVVSDDSGPMPVFELELHHPEFLDRPTFAIILEKAQGLGRVRSGSGPQGQWWCPVIELRERKTRAGSAERLGFAGDRDLLEHLMDGTDQPCRPGVCKWLENTGLFRVENEGSTGKGGGPTTEIVRLEPLDGPLFHGDVRRLLPGLITEFDRLAPGAGLPGASVTASGEGKNLKDAEG